MQQSWYCIESHLSPTKSSSTLFDPHQNLCPEIADLFWTWAANWRAVQKRACYQQKPHCFRPWHGQHAQQLRAIPGSWKGQWGGGQSKGSKPSMLPPYLEPTSLPPEPHFFPHHLLHKLHRSLPLLLKFGPSWMLHDQPQGRWREIFWVLNIPSRSGVMFKRAFCRVSAIMRSRRLVITL